MPIPISLTQQFAQSIRDNKGAVGSGASLDNLVVTLNEELFSLTVIIKPKAPTTLAGYLTNGSALEVITSKALWSTYPQISKIDLYVKRDGKSPTGESREELATFASVSRAGAEHFDYVRLKTQPSDDNKRLYCDADQFDVALDIWESLKDKGCMTAYSGGVAVGAGVRGPVSAQIPDVGVPVTLSSDGWILTVTKLSKTRSVQDILQSKRALGVYVVVDLTMANISNTSKAIGGDRFKIVDDRGREYNYYLDGTYIIGAEELGSKINAGLTGPARVIFDVPTDATGLILKSLGGYRVYLGNVESIAAR